MSAAEPVRLQACAECGHENMLPLPERCPECGRPPERDDLFAIVKSCRQASILFAVAWLLPVVIGVPLWIVADQSNSQIAFGAAAVGSCVGVVGAVGTYVLGLILLAGTFLLTSHRERRTHRPLRRATWLAVTIAFVPVLLLFLMYQ